ncbi:Sua5/YciO/YrdC/YwlC family protein [Fodinicola feengrottensis]|uniref:Sua5/YciO/YrdC/YwlC family protein n=1 Tax=Fodinicola feengrottensis TaxID=435914 RepID=UPI0024415412|nr:Sua5/YciO/YrdC/YwlC family protein [Fodinicola feengrottensis]
MSGRERRLVRVEGVVQGVGFRPFVYALANRLGVTGQVRNDSSGVLLDVEADPDTLARFIAAVRAQAPPLAVVEKVESTVADPVGWPAFAIVASQTQAQRNTLVSADSATCADCLAELDDPADRRYQYPFVNCTNCGPRFTIVKDVPYDRPFTTMAKFPICARCETEYHDPADRRFHAQPVCCPDCGPRLDLLDSAGQPLAGPSLPTAAEMLRAGAVLAIKGIGGYHLAVLATDEPAVATLRSRKHREDKPFAVMVATVDDAREWCSLDAAARKLLSGWRRPIVLCDRREGTALAKSVAPGNRQLGLMLAYTPLHHLLLRAVGGPIVLTSGNTSDEPIAYEDADALARLGTIADAFLTHDRPIHIRTDDSVARSVGGRPMMIRAPADTCRSR